MNCKRLVRVLPVFALTASLGYAAFFAKEVTLTFQGHDMVLTDVDGAWLSHEVAHTVQQGSGIKRKHIGNVKYEDCRVSMRVGQFDPIMLDMLNGALSGKLSKESLSLSGPQGMDLTYYGVRPHKIVTPGFDGDTCSDWEFAFGFESGNGYPGQYKMKAKEKANRTKCQADMRLILNDNGKPRIIDVTESEPVQTIIHEADLDGDGEFDSMSVDVGNVVVYVPAVQSGFFEEWMRASGENPLFEGNHKDGALRVRTDKFGSMEFDYRGLQPIAVTKMANGSVRVEFCAAEEQLKGNPRH
jgi:hypothetical protein